MNEENLEKKDLAFVEKSTFAGPFFIVKNFVK